METTGVEVSFQVNTEIFQSKKGKYLSLTTHTIAYFGEDRNAYPECNFPNPTVWNKTYEGCLEKYVMNTNWTILREHCGFSEIAGTDGFYSQTLTVERYYLLNSGTLQRVQRHTKELVFEYVLLLC